MKDAVRVVVILTRVAKEAFVVDLTFQDGIRPVQKGNMRSV